MTLRKTDRVGMIGLIAPVEKMLRPRVNDIFVFDKGISLLGGDDSSIMPMEAQRETLPTCDIVIVSGTTMINGSIDGILGMCSGARKIVMIGASTPMFPFAFEGSGVTVLAGSWWKSESGKRTSSRNITLACGISALGDYAIKKSVSDGLFAVDLLVRFVGRALCRLTSKGLPSCWPCSG